mmetsp:Transcript_25285/g.64244  ORF Transcript_25285/g.64244 Transcript_25285/m.64244 type:complete len:395 (-) Transcript_25285:721-1905(-)
MQFSLMQALLGAAKTTKRITGELGKKLQRCLVAGARALVVEHKSSAFSDVFNDEGMQAMQVELDGLMSPDQIQAFYKVVGSRKGPHSRYAISGPGVELRQAPFAVAAHMMACALGEDAELGTRGIVLAECAGGEVRYMRAAVLDGAVIVYNRLRGTQGLLPCIVSKCLARLAGTSFVDKPLGSQLMTWVSSTYYAACVCLAAEGAESEHGLQLLDALCRSICDIWVRPIREAAARAETALAGGEAPSLPDYCMMLGLSHLMHLLGTSGSQVPAGHTQITLKLVPVLAQLLGAMGQLLVGCGLGGGLQQAGASAEELELRLHDMFVACSQLAFCISNSLSTLAASSPAGLATACRLAAASGLWQQLPVLFRVYADLQTAASEAGIEEQALHMPGV